MAQKVGDILKGKELTVVRCDQSVWDVARLMVTKSIGAVPVLEGDRLVGIFSERDLMTRVIVAGKYPQKTQVGEVMTRELVVAEAEESAESCLTKMQNINARHLPVVSGNKLIGMVSMQDLLQIGLEAKDEEIKHLTAYIHYIPPGYT